MRTLVVDAYLGNRGGASDLLRHLPGEVEVVHAARDPLPRDLSPYRAALLSGSEASVVGPLTGWVASLVGWVQGALDADLPMLGFCFGHQILGRAAGAEVVQRAEPEVGWHRVWALEAEPLFDFITPGFRPFLTHGDEVLPHPALRVLARSERCAVQALQVKGRRAWGMQFHLELRPEDEEGFVRDRARRQPSLQPEALLAARTTGDPSMRALMTAFAQITAPNERG